MKLHPMQPIYPHWEYTPAHQAFICLTQGSGFLLKQSPLLIDVFATAQNYTLMLMNSASLKSQHIGVVMTGAFAVSGGIQRDGVCRGEGEWTVKRL
jgi:hypothetical protein